jgi:hypothetical protein
MFSFFIDYGRWHYSYAPLAILKLLKEFVRFFINLFSVSLFIRTLFNPLYSSPVNLKSARDGTDTFGLITGGVVIRVLGALFRLVLIICGLVLCMLSFVFFTCVFVIWVCMPIVIVGAVILLLNL